MMKAIDSFIEKIGAALFTLFSALFVGTVIGLFFLGLMSIATALDRFLGLA